MTFIQQRGPVQAAAAHSVLLGNQTHVDIKKALLCSSCPSVYTHTIHRLMDMVTESADDDLLH